MLILLDRIMVQKKHKKFERRAKIALGGGGDWKGLTSNDSLLNPQTCILKENQTKDMIFLLLFWEYQNQQNIPHESENFKYETINEESTTNLIFFRHIVR